MGQCMSRHRHRSAPAVPPSGTQSVVVRFSELPAMSRPLRICNNTLLLVDRRHDFGRDTWTISDRESVTLSLRRDAHDLSTSLAGSLLRLERVRTVIIEGHEDAKPGTAQVAASLSLCDVSMLVVRNTTLSGMMQLQSVSNVCITNCAIDATKGIVANGCGMLTVKDVTFACPRGCLSLENVQTVVLRGCSFMGDGDPGHEPADPHIPVSSFGVMCQAVVQNITLTDCRFMRLGAGIVFRGVMLTSAAIKRCHFDDIPRTALLFHVWHTGQGVRACIVSRCMLTPSCALGVYVDHVPDTTMSLHLKSCRWHAQRACSMADGAPDLTAFTVRGMASEPFEVLKVKNEND